MTSHISEELPRLLTGEATRDVVQLAASHLRICEDCQQELVSAVVAHASLTSAHRFAPEIVARPAQVGAHSVEDDALPDLSAIFAQVRDEAAGPPARRSRRPLYAVAAVAAGVLIGTGATAFVQHEGHNNVSTASGRPIPLAAYDAGTVPAKATLVGDHQLDLDATALPKLGANERYEVWLTNDAATEMQPVGWIGKDGKSSLTVPPDLIKHYDHIQVSVQSFDAATYTFSGTSVLRGSYAA
ncbi:MAG: hypothetical protein DLM57_17240 [Pseudonocardiales bacterium]|nr:MAG: hypothetical protein DLM57_17240 [Pseudonocardiales bacterium]